MQTCYSCVYVTYVMLYVMYRLYVVCSVCNVYSLCKAGILCAHVYAYAPVYVSVIGEVGDLDLG